MHYLQAIRNLNVLKRDLNKITANEMVNYALDNIRAQSFDGKRWPARNPKAVRNVGRNLLVDSGEGRRSITAKPDATGAKLTANEYMEAHNSGVNKNVSVRSHGRVSRKGRSTTVKQHTKKMNLPQRQFTGESPVQTARIQKIIANRIVKALT